MWLWMCSTGPHPWQSLGDERGVMMVVAKALGVWGLAAALLSQRFGSRHCQSSTTQASSGQQCIQQIQTTHVMFYVKYAHVANVRVVAGCRSQTSNARSSCPEATRHRFPTQPERLALNPHSAYRYGTYGIP